MNLIWFILYSYTIYSYSLIICEIIMKIIISRMIRKYIKTNQTITDKRDNKKLEIIEVFLNIL